MSDPQPSDRKHHAEQLVKIADLMEQSADDNSPDGRAFMRELRADYRAHAEAMGIDMDRTLPKLKMKPHPLYAAYRRACRKKR
ncbi:MAG: hypothetical protein HOO67_06360 [Candidatus Peribacteraceae bacterium]|nr:hypothetical protein [Candidatus Peribacteraceae bacterium]